MHLFFSPILLFQSEILRTLVSDTADEYQDVATSWLIALVVIAMGWALFSFALKWLIKKLAKLAKWISWGRGKTIAYMLVGLVLVAATVGLVWNASLNFTFVIGVQGLFKGIFEAGVMYIALMLIFHIFGDARHDLYY